jgi:hypothetical protein
MQATRPAQSHTLAPLAKEGRETVLAERTAPRAAVALGRSDYTAWSAGASIRGHEGGLHQRRMGRLHGRAELPAKEASIYDFPVSEEDGA